MASLPENYTVEFDLVATNLTQQTSSRAILEVRLEDHNSFGFSRNMSKVEIPFCKYVAAGIWVRNMEDGKAIINNPIQRDIRPAMDEVAHISIAVHGKRFRLWVNEQKIVDIPRLVPEGASYFKLYPSGFKEEERVFISDFRVAQAERDLRSLLRENGSFSTTGILFESGSSQLKGQSYGVLTEIASLLRSDPQLRLQVVGHTDSDGDDAYNLQLSRQRAEAVKNILEMEYAVEPGRLTTDGKGETQPVDDNSTISGKANNRRVEFIQI